MKKFLAVTEAANVAYMADPDASLETVAGAAGMDVQATKAMLANFGYPTVEEQLGPNWLGGGVVRRRPRASRRSWSPPATSTRRSTTIRPSSTRAS